MSLYESKTTDNHERIKQWVKHRDGKPALMDGIVPEHRGGEMLRISFMDGRDGPLHEISWDKFFEIFDDNNLLFLYQEETEDGKKSKFYRFIRRSKEMSDNKTPRS